MAVPVYRTSTTTTWSFGDGTIAVPASTVNGDLLILAVGGDLSASEDHTYTVTGFTSLLADTRSHASNAGVDLQVFYRIASSEPANYTVDIDSDNLSGATMIRIDGQDAADGFDVSLITPYDNSTEAKIPSITTTVAECLIIGIVSWDASKTLTSVPAGTTAIAHVDVSGYDQHSIHFNQASAGATGVKQYDLSSASPHVGAAIAVQPTQGGDTTLIVQDASHSHSVDNVVLTQVHNITVADSAHSHTVDGVVVTQLHNLTVADCLHGHLADNIILTQLHNIVVADALHSHLAESPILTEDTPLLVAEASHNHLADNVALTQAHLLAVSDALHSHPVENVLLSQLHLLAVADSLHGHSADSPTLVPDYLLSVQDALHNHLVDNVVLTQLHNLAVSDATHAHSVDSLLLSQFHLLAVADALHSHLVDNIVLVPGVIPLTVQDALHGHTVDNIALLQAHTLVIADALHSHFADNVHLIGTFLEGGTPDSGVLSRPSALGTGEYAGDENPSGSFPRDANTGGAYAPASNPSGSWIES